MTRRLSITAAVLLLGCGYAAAESLCTDRSPAAIARALDVSLDASSRSRVDKPNVIVILADDMGYSDLASYGGDVPTPNIDRIGDEGIRFTRGYTASPVCSPSRAGLMTGKFPPAIGHTRNAITSAYWHKHPKNGLPIAEKTMANYFKKLGYVTGIIGKWHLGGSKKYFPQDRGFDEYFYRDHFESLNSYYYPQYMHNLRRNSKQPLILKHLNEMACDNDAKYLTHVQGLEAAGFILRHRDKPFFLYFSTAAMHSPYQAKKEGWADYLSYYWRYPGYFRHLLNPEKRIKIRMLMQLDEAVGYVLDVIDALGLAENTLVWFLSDNGAPRLKMSGSLSSSPPLRGHKGSLLEGGIRVPFMVRWPNVLPQATIEWPVIATDILPTSLAAADSHYAENPPPMDGMNILPNLKAQRPPPVRDFYWAQGTFHSQGEARAMIMRGQWKLISFYSGPVGTSDPATTACIT